MWYPRLHRSEARGTELQSAAALPESAPPTEKPDDVYSDDGKEFKRQLNPRETEETENRANHYPKKDRVKVGLKVKAPNFKLISTLLFLLP